MNRVIIRTTAARIVWMKCTACFLLFSVLLFRKDLTCGFPSINEQTNRKNTQRHNNNIRKALKRGENTSRKYTKGRETVEGRIR
jgi:hypothetical protein